MRAAARGVPGAEQQRTAAPPDAAGLSRDGRRFAPCRGQLHDGGVLRFDQIGIPTTDRFDGEIALAHPTTTVSDHRAMSIDRAVHVRERGGGEGRWGRA
jgi:hypothetical protein